MGGRKRKMTGGVRRRKNFYATRTGGAGDAAPGASGPAAEAALVRRRVSRALRDRPWDTRLLLKGSDVLLRASLVEERLGPSRDADMEAKLHAVSRDILRQFGAQDYPD